MSLIKLMYSPKVTKNSSLTMEDWESRLNKFIEATDRTILQNAGKVSAEIARAHAEPKVILIRK